MARDLNWNAKLKIEEDEMAENKVVVVTGAARGIGRATARHLADNGWTVIGIDRDKEALETSVTSLSSNGAASAVTADLTQLAEVDKAIAGIADKMGPASTRSSIAPASPAQRVYGRMSLTRKTSTRFTASTFMLRCF